MITHRVESSDLLARRCLLGVRFTDASTGKRVPDGIYSELRARFGIRLARQAVQGPSGVHSFHSLPGMRAFEDEDLDLPLPAGTLEFALFAHDAARRFLPVTLTVLLPRAAAELEVPLFPAPSYPARPDWALLRARLGDRTLVQPGETPDAGGRPAAWAVVDVSIGGLTVARGMTDARGELVVPFPYPRGPGAAGWTASLSVRYRPAQQVRLLPARDRAPGMATVPVDPPELSSLLGQTAAPVIPFWDAVTEAAPLAAFDFPVVTGEFARAMTGMRNDLWLVPITP